jgi:orotate phosphoribosyltransferase
LLILSFGCTVWFEYSPKEEVMADIFSEVVPFTRERIGVDQICQMILDSGQVELRDVQAGELPFEYSASTPENPIFGPGYILIKALVGQDELFFPLVNQLALRVEEAGLELDVICGNVSGGMVPGYLLKLYLTHMYGRLVRYIYARDTRKKHGSSEMLVGVDNNPFLEGQLYIGDVEELVNNAKTTCNAALTLRNSGFRCDQALTILDYQNVDAIARREGIGLTQISLVTLPQLLAYAQEQRRWPVHVTKDYLSYLDSPAAWRERNMEAIQRALVEKGS